MSLEEYEAQLEEVEELLKESPTDESFLQLKNDVLELIALAKQGDADVDDVDSGVDDAGADGNNAGTDGNEEEGQKIEQVHNTNTNTIYADEQLQTQQQQQQQRTPESLTTTETAAAAAAAPSNQIEEGSNNNNANNKLKKVKDFQVPIHLIPDQADTETERNKKKRALKALKNKWRMKKKNYEADKKQQSWKNFQKKKKSNNGCHNNDNDNNYNHSGSIFATGDHSSKVGVVVSSAVGGRNLSEFQQRKRHKY